VLRTADVDQPPASGVTYATELAQDHRHEATLSPEELRELSLGRAIGVTSTVSPTPAPHTHSFEIHDRVGLWGASAALLGDDRWWPLPEAMFNEYRSRANVEIYNMPILMEREHLLPEPGISVVSYLYASATPEDPNQPMPGWERTADNQPVVILRKTSVIEPYYSRAICGFEPWRLRQSSMLDLADHVLLRAFRLGVPEAN
jgi:hypothetical protein